MEPWSPQPTGTTSRGPADYLGVISRHRWLVILVVGWTLGLAALYSFTRPTLYTSESEVLIGDGIVSFDGGSSTGDVNPETESQVLESTAVAQLAASRLDGNPSVESLLRSVSVDVPENTEILHIPFSAGDPLDARDGADAFAEAYLEYRGNQFSDEAAARVSKLETERDALIDEISSQRDRLQSLDPSSTEYTIAQEQLSNLEARREIIENQLLLARSVTIDPGQVIARAITPTSPSSPNHQLDLALGAVIGLGLAFGLAYIRDRKSTSFDSATELEAELGVPVMAVIPSFRDERLGAQDPIALYKSGGPISDGYRSLRAAVLARAERSRLVTIAITSARSGEGKSMTAAMLAVALASAGRRVVLIDGDLRRPMVSKLGVDDRLGLADVLAGRVDSVLDAMQTTSVRGLSVVPSGRAGPASDPAELLQPDHMRKVLEDCGFADFVILDTPAALAVSDALVLAPLADGVLIVASAKGTSAETASYAKLQLDRMDANIIGSVLIGVRRPEGQELGYYYRLDRPGVRINPLGRSPETNPRATAPEVSGTAAGRGPSPVQGSTAADELPWTLEQDAGGASSRSAAREGSMSPPMDDPAMTDTPALSEDSRSIARGATAEPGASDILPLTPPLPPPPGNVAPPVTRSGGTTAKHRRARTSKASGSEDDALPDGTAPASRSKAKDGPKEAPIDGAASTPGPGEPELAIDPEPGASAAVADELSAGDGLEVDHVEASDASDVEAAKTTSAKGSGSPRGQAAKRRRARQKRSTAAARARASDTPPESEGDEHGNSTLAPDPADASPAEGEDGQ